MSLRVMLYKFPKTKVMINMCLIFQCLKMISILDLASYINMMKLTLCLVRKECKLKCNIDNVNAMQVIHMQLR